ncbi:MAG: hypothetical protein UT24_C0007G0012 [Candidatus Woesebacteria bacterium GW2011_GWB1_39_12]|uniref:HMA domain-containing protein n=2 Tax=Candidatus Woeseibacteriota TaxID=1752722 RepID=A0A0G0M4L8_9BACT|nr:MAG: hypothetical protein UT23_C0004G0091 [Candidatus Woesebacteria bacterium GW2011_GWA1_39_12]KKR01050.1 MAG: hypothetical protein UT24_C0007G0012 [Candidatus Woesebacteria bacterium GW2011_GWB1_39_12]
MKKKVYKIKGMDCDACAKLIELDLEDAGIKASCNYAKETLEVELNDDKEKEKKVKDVIEKGGYQLTQN